MIKNLYIYLTWRCNLRCKHCWVSDKSETSFNAAEIPDSQYSDIVLQACNLGVNFVKISGGEPLLRWNALETVMKTAKEKNCELLLETNGTLLEPRMVDFFKEMNCDISISLDGNQSKHNALRNDPAAFQRTCEGIKMLISGGVIPQIVYSFSEVDYEEIDNMIEMLNQFGIRELKLNPIMRIGRGKHIRSDNSIDNAFTINAGELLQLKNTYCNKPRGNLRIRMMLPVSFDGYAMLFNKNTVFISCPFESLLSVLPNGDVGLCGEAKNIQEFQYGNIRESTLSEIVNCSVNYQTVQKLATELQGVCKTCVAKKLCKGSCRVVAYRQNNSIYSSNPLCEEMHRMGKFPF